MFTGKERDAETGLDFFGARYFSAAQGRWTSPDAPLVDQDPAAPQSWNLYGYGRNNPVINIDPTGRCSQGSDGKMHDDADGKCADVNSVTVTEKIPKVRDLAAEAQAEMTRLQYEAWKRNQERNKPKEDQPLPEDARKILTVAYLQTTERLNCLGVPVEFGAGYALFRGGQPVPGSKPFVTPGSSVGTSPISGALRRLNVDLPVAVPSPVGGPGTGVPFRFAGAKSLGAVLGRYAPFAGIAGMGLSVAHAVYCVSQ